MPSSPLLIALDLPLVAGDVAFTFAAGAGAGAARGTGVIVPFGRRLLPGIVLGQAAPRPNLRPVLAVLEPAPMIPEPVIALSEWTARQYVSSVGEALAVAVPWESLWRGVRLRARVPAPGGLSAASARLAGAFEKRPLSLARAARLLAPAPEAAVELASACALEGVIAAAGRTGGAPSSGSAEAEGTAGQIADPSSGRALPGAVRAALRERLAEVSAGGPRILLVAGWRRTPAYLSAIGYGLAAGWSCLALYAATDAAGAFAAAAAARGHRPILLHAGLPPAVRRAAWQRLVGARGALVVGTRAAVFAPVAGPVLIILDDEDSSGHKEERAPRFLTRTVAERRVGDEGVLVLGATTPTVATYAAVGAGRIRLIGLPSPRPQIGVVDLRRRVDPDAALSSPVLDAVRRTVRAGGRAVLLTDRKGYAGGLHCAECGSVERCPQCGVAVSYDRARRRLTCRLCGRRWPAPHVCSRCGAARLHPVGAGTERLAALLRRLIPRVWRFDADIVTPRRDPRAALAPFQARGGVLVATALVLPYLEHLHPDLVALVAADRLLHRAEFRAAERALALLRTLSMASGSRVMVETADPQHPAVTAVQAPTLRSFYAAELDLRRRLGYPPFCLLAGVTMEGRTEPAVSGAVARLVAAGAPHVEVLGPTPGRPVRGRVTCHVVLKAPDRAALTATLWQAVSAATGVRLTADVDPIEL